MAERASKELRVLIAHPLCNESTLCCSDTVRAVARPKLLVHSVKALTWCAHKNFVILRDRGLMGSGLVGKETFCGVKQAKDLCLYSIKRHHINVFIHHESFEKLPPTYTDTFCNALPAAVWPSFVLICPDPVSKDQLDQQWTWCHISTAGTLAWHHRHGALGSGCSAADSSSWLGAGVD